ncbi:MAG: alpha/beta fold hydrolase [Pseudomonadota bacterium]
MHLAQTEYPPEDADDDLAPLVVVPGLFGSARNWRAHAKRLGPGRHVIAVDMRNHGSSGWNDVHDYPAMAGDLAELIEGIGGHAAVLGHSMGGKAAMLLAQTRPDLVERLIVADIAPIAYDHDLLGEIDAMLATDLTGLTRRSEVEAALGAHIAIPAVRSFLAQSAILDDTPRWSLNLKALSANMDLITGYPDEQRSYPGQTMFLSGAASDYVLPEHHDLIVQRFPNARFEVLEGAGHWLHADKPREFLDAANGFLSD